MLSKECTVVDGSNFLGSRHLTVETPTISTVRNPTIPTVENPTIPTVKNPTIHLPLYLSLS